MSYSSLVFCTKVTVRYFSFSSLSYCSACVQHFLVQSLINISNIFCHTVGLANSINIYYIGWLDGKNSKWDQRGRPYTTWTNFKHFLTPPSPPRGQSWIFKSIFYFEFCFCLFTRQKLFRCSWLFYSCLLNKNLHLLLV